jgi:hypothetical protein
MGTVWRANDTLLRRDVAVKEVVLPPGLAPTDRDAMYERTLREARAAAAIQHPAVVQVYDVVTEGGRPWIVMELLDARSLADMVIEDGPVAPRAVAKIGIALLGALEVAHALGVLHRDVKPANVLICSDGRCVLTDFGVAKLSTDVQLTTPGMVLGSPHFISPERAMGQDFGPPSDLFSLGVTLYTAVEGRPPFDRGDPIETMHAVVEDPPAPPQRSGPLTQVLMGLLEKDPARRLDVHTARTMLRELLAGPLTSVASAVHSVTDPYAVVPVAPRPPVVAPPAPESKPSGQIGGSAMLAPGESLTDRLAKLRRDEKPALPAPGAAPEETGADAGAGPLSAPTGAMAPPTPPTAAPPATPTSPAAPAGRTYGGSAEATQRVDAGAAPEATQHLGYGASADATQQVPSGVRADLTARFPFAAGAGPRRAGQADATQRVGQPDATQAMPGYGGAPQRAGGTYGGGQPWAVPGTGQPWAAPAPEPAAQGGALAAVKALPRKVRLAAVGGVVAVLLVIGGVVLFGGDDPQPPATPQGQQGGAPAAPALEMEEQSAKGVTVRVPKGWERRTAEGAVWVDFVDPQDNGRKVRVLAEAWSTTSMRWAESAANGLRSRPTSCPKPYNQVALSAQKLDGQDAAELEYTCGEGDAMRHGVWRGVVHEGKVYSFYLSSTHARFAESKPIFDGMVESFRLGGAD